MRGYIAVRETGKYGFPKLKEVNLNALVKQQSVNNGDVPTLTRPEMFPERTEVTDDQVVGGIPCLSTPSMSFEGQATPTSTPSADDGIPILDAPEMEFKK